VRLAVGDWGAAAVGSGHKFDFGWKAIHYCPALTSERGARVRFAEARHRERRRVRATGDYHDGNMTNRHGSEWTAEERAREERARAIRARQGRDKLPEERLEETLRLSRLMSELQQGAAPDVPGR
jgi:hypothetical protein